MVMSFRMGHKEIVQYYRIDKIRFVAFQKAAPATETPNQEPVNPEGAWEASQASIESESSFSHETRSTGDSTRQWFEAVQDQNLQAVNELLQNGLDVNLKDEVSLYQGLVSKCQLVFLNSPGRTQVQRPP